MAGILRRPPSRTSQIKPDESMPRTRSRALVFLALLAIAACDLGGPGADVLAEAEGMELTVDEAAGLLSSQSQVPAEPQVVRALTDLWIDYSLLAVAAAEDSTLSHLDMSALLRQREEQQMISALRESILAEADTAVSEEELEQVWEQEAPGARIHARHILLSVPDDASEAQRDSVVELAADLAERIRGGADFAELAGEHSDDRGTAAEGGDLGFFEQGEMVAGFEEAAFALEPGEVSDPVRTPFGVHVIRVEERETPSLDEVRDQFRERVQTQRVLSAESLYVAGLPRLETIEVREGAVDALRELAEDPDRTLSRRAASRELVRYEGGGVTAREIQEFIRHRPPGIRGQIEAAPDEQLEGFLQDLGRTELLVEAAREAGHAPSEAARDTIARETRARIVEATQVLGLMNVTPGEDQSLEEAIQQEVMSYLEGILQGTRDVIPLGGVAFALREEYDVEVNDEAVDRVVEQLGAGQEQAAPGLPAPGEGVPNPAPGVGDDPAGVPPVVDTPPSSEAEGG